MDHPLPTLSIVLPACNVGGNVARITERLCAVLEGLGKPFEIIWVNGVSTDATADELDVLGKSNPAASPGENG